MPGSTEPADVTRRLPMLLALAGLFLLLWMLLGLVEVAALVHNPHVPILHPIAIVLASTVVVGGGLAWALGTRWFERVSAEQPGRWFRHQLRGLPVAIVVGVLLILAARQAVYYLMQANYQYLSWPVVMFWEAIKITVFYCLWLGLMLGLLMLERWREESNRMLAAQKALADAQLAQLQNQLRPHFLFNALNTVSALMLTDTARADRVLTELGDLLRASLAGGRAGFAPLREELKLLRKYGDIMQERFEGRAVLRWLVAEGALDVPVPSMLFQPLLENAFKHGVERNSDPVEITVSATRVGDELCVEIHNSGSHLDGSAEVLTAADALTVAEASTDASGDRVGLRNCRERLRLIYGPAAHLSVSNDPAGGVRARVSLPCRPPTP